MTRAAPKPDRTLARVAVLGVACALLSMALGSSHVLFVLALYWMLGSTGVAFACGGMVRRLLDGPGMEPRSLRAIARAADDPQRPRPVRRTAAALWMYMAGMAFCAGAAGTIGLVAVLLRAYSGWTQPPI